MTTEPLLRARAVGLRRGSAALVRGVTLDAHRGEVLGLVGPNGAGKTTLLGLLAGDLRASEGTIAFDGVPIERLSELELAKRRAVMAQSTEVAFAFTALEIVLFGRSPFGARESAEDLAIAREAIEKVGLGALANRRYPELSGGEQQRVHLARTLAQVSLGRTGLALFLDEPTASLDPAHQHRALAMAREIAAAGLAVVAVLHDLDLAARYCDRVALMSNGELVRAGPPREVFESSVLKAVFDIGARVIPAPWDASKVSVIFDPS
ncbi:MAG: heme ABC transporter ATP-binding protein [Polyangiaceae bacterium]